MVTIKYRGGLASKIQKNHEELQAATVMDVLRQIKGAYGSEAYKEAKRMLITVNNESTQLHKGLRTPLHEGDVVSFLPVAGGG